MDINNTEPEVIAAELVDMEKNSYYVISFEYVCKEWDESAYLDFYTSSYDSQELDVILDLQLGEGKYSVIVYSGEIPLDEDCYFRILSQSNGTIDLQIKNLMIRKCGTMSNEIYQLVTAGEGIFDSQAVVYENINANDILYIPEKVVKTDDISIVYDYVNRGVFRQNKLCGLYR